MKAQNLKINNLLLVQEKVFRDQRGAFEVFWESEWSGILPVNFSVTSAHHSYNRFAGTLRGLHYQAAPYQQAKLVSCVSGKVFDVVVDLREESETFLEWAAVELEAGSGKTLFIPRGCAHGFVTLEDNTTVAYLIEGEYRPDSAKIVRWNDPQLAIVWPINEPILSVRDKNAPLVNQI